VNTSNVASCTLRALLLFAAVASANAQGDVPISQRLGLGSLTAAQRKAVDTFVLEHQRPTGDLRQLADRGGMGVRSSAALRRLFSHSRFVVVPWVLQAESSAKNMYSIPYGLYDVLAINDEGQQEATFHSSGNHEEFGLFLHNHRVKVRNESMACEVAKALAAIYGAGLSTCNDVRRSSSEWLLSYKEMPFRPVSSNEEVREAYYYRMGVDSGGLVLRGTLVCETLERRKIDKAGKPAVDH
jgi:hypothetical protein